MTAASKRKRPREYRKTGLYTLRRQLIDLGSRAIDGRSSVGVALRKWRTDLADDLGGYDALSTQQKSLIELAARSKIMLDSIDSWLLGQKSLVNVRKKSLMPVVVQRQSIAEHYSKVLERLGLKKVQRERSLEDYFSEDQNADADTTETGGSTAESMRDSRRD